MKKIKYFIMFLLMINLYKCASGKLRNAFDVTKTSIHKNEKNIIIRLIINNNENVIFKNMYYDNQIAIVKVENNNSEITATFSRAPFLNDIELYGDSKKEFGNSIKNFPVDSSGEKLFVSYKKNGKTYYQKIKIIKK